MSFQEEINWLVLEIKKTLDLDVLEAKIYLSLLRSGPITASALAKELDVDRARMYRTVDRLINRNIVSTTLSSPKLCIATDPQTTLKMALRKKEDEINRIRKSGQSIINKINNDITTNQEGSVPTFRIAQGRTNIYADIAQIIEKSKDIVYIVTTLEDVSRMYHSSIPEKITVCEKNGGSVRLLVEMDDPKLLRFVNRFNATETKIGKLPSKGRIIVRDGKTMIMSGSSTSQISTNSEADSSLCTNSKEMVNNIYSLCTFLWNRSQSIKTLDMKKYIRK